jgi:hypothetical protein
MKDIRQYEAEKFRVENGNTSVAVTSDKLKVIIVEDGSVTYIAEAPVGTAVSTPIWTIQKIDETTGTIITWAFNVAQEDYATVTYS